MSTICCADMSRVGVTYMAGFRLDDWIYWHIIHNTGLQTIQCYRWSTHFTVHCYTHTVFSDFTSRIRATDLWQSYCYFRTSMKSSFHNLLPFLPFFCNCQPNSSAPKPYPGRMASRNSTRIFFCAAEHFFIITLHGPRRKYPLLLTRRVY
jgi:hypothetical protein